LRFAGSVGKKLDLNQSGELMFTVVAAFLLSAGAAQAPAVAAPAVAQAQVAAPAAKPKKICRSEVGTGSILPKRVCLTQQEWDARSQASEGDAEALRRAQGGRMPGSTN
jgi:invasion protein IalB